MSETEMIRVGEPLPRIQSISACEKRQVEVVWQDGARKVVDLAPAVFTYKLYRPLREDDALFRTVHVVDGGSAIAWGQGDDLNMDASTVARLAKETMEPSDFAAFLRRNELSYDGAAAQLGISRRLVAYYASERQVPRYIALACAHLDRAREEGDGRGRATAAPAPIAT
jgi:hypothetical protein